jgi:hypothetical protein
MLLCGAAIHVIFQGQAYVKENNIMAADASNTIAELVVQSMTDATLRANLLQNPAQVLQEHGIQVPDTPRIVTVADTDTLFNIVVPQTPLTPTQQLVTLPPNPTPFQIGAWIVTHVQLGGTLAAELQANPVSVLTGMGVNLPSRMQIQVLVDTPLIRHMALPYFGSPAHVPNTVMSGALGKGSPVNVNVNVNVNANVQVNAVAVVNVAAVGNVEAALQVSSALVAAEVIAVAII